MSDEKMAELRKLSDVQDVGGPTAFTVRDGLEDGTLVLGKGISEGLQEGNNVQITGTVHSFIKSRRGTGLRHRFQ